MPNQQVVLPMQCDLCGHIQQVNGIKTVEGPTYFSSSYDWCDRCEDGVPQPIGPVVPYAQTVPKVSIEQLFEQASSGCFPTDITLVHPSELRHFAELVVRECVKIVNDHSDKETLLTVFGYNDV